MKELKIIQQDKLCLLRRKHGGTNEEAGDNNFEN